MKKIIFFTQTTWAFGNIHNSLNRILYKENYLCDILDWSISKSLEEMKHIQDSVDFFVTVPAAIPCLLSYGIPYNKIIGIAHGEIDILATIQNNSGYEIFEKIYKYAVIGDWLKNKSIGYGIKRSPEVLHIGVDERRYYQDVPSQLKSVGFGGNPSVKDYFGNEIKRGYLVKQCCDMVGIKFVTNSGDYIHYTGMPSFYKRVDCVIMASTQETVGLPMMEAAAAGRLVIGTEVGVNSTHKNSIIVPMEETQFIQKTVEILSFYKNNPEAFRQKCLEQQRYAFTHYKWENFVYEWVNFLQ